MGSTGTIPAFSQEYMNETRGPLVRGVAITFMVLEISVVTMRLASRRLVKAPLGLDDLLVFPSLGFCVALSGFAIAETHIAGVGRHLDVLFVTNPQAIINWLKCGYAIEQLYCTAVVFPKLSILASYLRIFLTRGYRRAAYALAVVVVSNGIAGVVTSLASCQPFSARWQGVEYAALHCIDTVAYWRWISFPNILTDVVMIVLPLPVIWGLQMSQKERIGLTLIFLTGGLGLVTSIIRFTIFFNVKALTNDGTFVSADLAIWSLVEPGMYLLAACLPTLRPLILKLFGGVRAAKNISGESSKTDDVQLEWRSRRNHSRLSDEDNILDH
ncbi:hypothetical protein K458DRAFT_432368 [Lentithecium fluviatile CBS 122367]|uniref:Rhodopsin domain-containing protein n=1 Tax=Lentithecium fluviatile CBS 122367 TaxID=1168545 RepID=A0A6G1IYC9_9PLEO|nr:hypothetical protein K458DRAFT_432368 [Lentithecium fluviatile CBS 122367]